MKDKVKQRQKSLSKGNGLIKEEHKFPVINAFAEKKDTSKNYLNIEEANNLQDMINYAASLNQNEKQDIASNSNEVFANDRPEVQETPNKQDDLPTGLNPNEKLDMSFKEALKRYELLFINKSFVIFIICLPFLQLFL